MMLGRFKKKAIAMAFGQDIDPLQAVLNQFSFVAELKKNVFLQRGAGAASFTRGTTATVTDFAGCLNGGSVVTDTAGSLPTVTTINEGNYNAASAQAKIPVGPIMVAQRAISNAEMQIVTR